jgi:hypothetical protein
MPRYDREGGFHTLEEDIQEIWKAHGWTVLEEQVKKEGSDGVWMIKAKPLHLPKSSPK